MDRFDDAQASSQSAKLIAALSHDLRTPLNGVLGMAELLLTADDLSDRHRRRVEIIKRSGKNLLAMLEQLFDFAKIEAQIPVLATLPFDLRDVVRDAQKDCRSRAVEYDVVDELDNHHRAIGDASRVKKLLINFVMTCTQRFATAETLRITAKARATTAEKLRVRFEAQDASIDADAIAHALELLNHDQSAPADCLDEADLALIICHKLVTPLHGQIGVDRLSDASSVFWLELDLETSAKPATAQAFPSAPVDAEQPPSEPMARDVLVAEDNPDMALLIEDFLEEAGYRATVVPDGASVLKALGEQHVDVVLMDGRMPDMTGFETTDRIRELPDERANVPIIALTADALAGDREKYLSAGMDDYVAKPVDYEQLLAAIERCCREKRRETAAPISS